MTRVNISARTDYAVRALLALAQTEAEAGRPVSAETIAGTAALPAKFLESILGDLRRGGLVTSQRGQNGGYRLAHPADRTTLGSVFRAVDGPLAEVRGARPHDTAYAGAAEHLNVVWVAVRQSLRQVLDEVTLADVLAGTFPEHVRALAADPDAWRSR